MPAAACFPPGIAEEQLLADLRRLCWGAADILLAYGRGEQPPYGFPKALSVDEGGEGPVSAADLAVNQWLLEGLAKAYPDAGWTLLSEETAKEQLTAGEPLDAEWLWILDPLDGTKDFLQGTGEYAVHLALVHRGEAVLGVVLQPLLEDLWFGLVPEGRAWRENRAGEQQPAQLSRRQALGEMVLVASRNHRDQRLRAAAGGPGPWRHQGDRQRRRQGRHDPARRDRCLHLPLGQERSEGLGHGGSGGRAQGGGWRLHPR